VTVAHRRQIIYERGVFRLRDPFVMGHVTWTVEDRGYQDCRRFFDSSKAGYGWSAQHCATQCFCSYRKYCMWHFNTFSIHLKYSTAIFLGHIIAQITHFEDLSDLLRTFRNDNAFLRLGKWWWEFWHLLRDVNVIGLQFALWRLLNSVLYLPPVKTKNSFFLKIIAKSIAIKIAIGYCLYSVLLMILQYFSNIVSK